jgi:uncharacterized membrane protein YphA (DoxX/SURF4 family)
MSAGASPWPRRLGLAACWILAAVFLLAAWPKVTHPHAFAESIYRYHLLDHDWINVQAVYLPWLELVCALALLAAPRLRRGALLLVLLMLIMFTTAIAINVYRGVDIDCGCFSVSRDRPSRIGWWNLARNAALLALVGRRMALGNATRPARSTMSNLSRISIKGILLGFLTDLAGSITVGLLIGVLAMGLLAVAIRRRPGAAISRTISELVHLHLHQSPTSCCPAASLGLCCTALGGYRVPAGSARRAPLLNAAPAGGAQRGPHGFFHRRARTLAALVHLSSAT